MSNSVLRFQAACAAMAGLIPSFDFDDNCSSNESYWNDPEKVAAEALAYADALLAKLAEPEPIGIQPTPEVEKAVVDALEAYERTQADEGLDIQNLRCGHSQPPCQKCIDHGVLLIANVGNVQDVQNVQEPKKAREFYLSESTSILAGGVATHLTWHVVEKPTPHFLETYKYIKVREVLE